MLFRSSASKRAQIRTPATHNIDAYQLYLKGRYHWNKRTEEGFKKGIEYFEQAIEKDPNYALAYAGLADCWLLIGNPDYHYYPARDAYTRAKVAITKALEIENSLAEAHTSLANLKHMYEWDWNGAEKEFKKAIELNPNYAKIGRASCRERV